MPAGLQIYNSNNVLTIDSTYQNMQLLSKVTAIFDRPESTSRINDMAIAQIPDIPSGSLVAISSSFPVVRILNRSFIRAPLANMNQSATVYVFGPATNVPAPSGYGLQVFTEDGRLAFDSGFRYMRVAGMFSVGDVRSPGQNNSFGQKVFAVAQSSPVLYSTLRASGGGADPNGTGANVGYVGTYTTENGVGWGTIRTTTNTVFGDGVALYARGSSSALVLDVTNY